MKNFSWKIAALLIVMSVTTGIPSPAQTTPAVALKLPVTGTFAGGGEFTGAASINRFERNATNQIVAVGFVTGTLSRGRNSLGTAVAGEVAWPVVVRSGGVVVTSTQAEGNAKLTRIAWSPDSRPTARIRPVQDSCPVLQISLGPLDVNLLGVQVSLGAISLDIAGQRGTPLGGLVCTVSDVLSLLNSLLGLLTGLLGGILP